jgi:cytochrome c-type biogenesis protein CcmH/NrfG
MVEILEELSDSTLARPTLARHYMRQNKFAAAEQVHREGIAFRPRRRERQEAYAVSLSSTGAGST